MVTLTPIQMLGLVCLVVFSIFVMIVLVLECIGRFHCSLRRRNLKNSDYNEKHYHQQEESGDAKSSFLGNLCCWRVGVSSGIGCKCTDLMCYCCWKQYDDELQVIALPNSRTINNMTHYMDILNKSCVICLEELTTCELQKRLLALDCGHEFHTDCIMKWLKQSYKCPLCNQVLNVDVIVETTSLSSYEHVFLSEHSIDSITHV